MADDPTDPADDDQSDAGVSASEPGEGKGADVDSQGDGAATTKTGPPAAAPKVVRKKVTSKRVTPKGAAQGAKVSSTPVSTSSRKAEVVDDDESYSKRYTPPQSTYAQGPSPWWVPTLMFGLLIVGALIIMLNYMEVFGEPANLRLVLGLGFILGGIITATQYR